LISEAERLLAEKLPREMEQALFSSLGLVPPDGANWLDYIAVGVVRPDDNEAAIKAIAAVFLGYIRKIVATPQAGWTLYDFYAGQDFLTPDEYRRDALPNAERYARRFDFAAMREKAELLLIERDKITAKQRDTNRTVNALERRKRETEAFADFYQQAKDMRLFYLNERLQVAMKPAPERARDTSKDAYAIATKNEKIISKNREIAKAKEKLSTYTFEDYLDKHYPNGTVWEERISASYDFDQMIAKEKNAISAKEKTRNELENINPLYKHVTEKDPRSDALRVLSLKEAIEAEKLEEQQTAQKVKSHVLRIDDDIDKQEAAYTQLEHDRRAIDLKLDQLEASQVVAPEMRKFQTFAHLYNPAVFTPDRAGYMAYLNRVRPFKMLSQYFPAYLPEAERKKHTYITGATGRGKTELLKTLVRAYVARPELGSVVIIEPHGAFAEQVARWSDVIESGRLVYIDPEFAHKYGQTPALNPFDIADKSDRNVEDTAEELTSMLQELMRQANHGELTANMKTLLPQCISTLLRMPNASLNDLQKFMNSNTNTELKNSKYAVDREFFKYHFDNKHFDSTKEALALRIQSLINTPTRKRLLTGKNTFDLSQLISERKIIIFRLSTVDMHDEASAAFGNFVVSMLISHVLRRFRSDKNAEFIPVHLFIDECQKFVSPSIHKILTETRKFGLHLTLAQQNYGDQMDESVKRAIALASINITSQTGDSKTLARMSNLMGLEESEIKNLPVGQFQCKIAGDSPPFKLYIPDTYIDNRGGVSSERWEQVKQEQMRLYYRPVNEAGQEEAASGERLQKDQEPNEKPKINLV
jgi:hypothetical protein